MSSSVFQFVYCSHLYDAIIIDSTHIKMKWAKHITWGFGWHIAQLDDDMVEQLKLVGKINNRGSFIEG